MKNNFEALMPLIARYVEEHPKEYAQFEKERETEVTSSIFDETAKFLQWCNEHNKNPKNPDSLKQYLKETSDAKTTNS